MKMPAIRARIPLLATAAALFGCLGVQAAPQQAVSPISSDAQIKARSTRVVAPSRQADPRHAAAVPRMPAVAVPTSATQTPVKLARRDPFHPLLGHGQSADAPEHLPPGKAGLIISRLSVLGVATSAHGTIAVVANNQGRVYFLHSGDRLYDGRVASVSLNSVSFLEDGKDAFGRAVQVAVTKRLVPTLGAQP